MVERKPTSYRSLIRIGLVVCASEPLSRFDFLLDSRADVFRWAPMESRVFCGVSLANTNLQKSAFGTVAAFGGKATMAVRNSWFSTTNKTQLTNVENTFNDMKRAGISFPYGLTLKTIPTP
ncbi:hypothetical protein [Pedosphaera parvula]|nr:hypothetical protein [Pedosphaera parvula]